MEEIILYLLWVRMQWISLIVIAIEAYTGRRKSPFSLRGVSQSQGQVPATVADDSFVTESSKQLPLERKTSTEK